MIWVVGITSFLCVTGLHIALFMKYIEDKNTGCNFITREQLNKEVDKIIDEDVT